MINNKLIEIFPRCGLKETHYVDSGVKVRIEPKPNERVIFFSIDKQFSTFREDFNITGQVCDLLVYYKVKGKNETVLCLTELKGVNTDVAINQIKNTYKSIRSKIRQNCCEPIILKGYICVHRKASPIQTKFVISDMFQPGNFQISREEDIGIFLRKNGYN